MSFANRLLRAFSPLSFSLPPIPHGPHRRLFSTTPSLPSSMRAQVLRQSGSPWSMSMERLRLPIPQAGEVLVKTKAVGVCHTDLHIMLGDIKFPIPAVMGHEAVGEVVSIGGPKGLSTQNIKVGQKVASPFIMPCGECSMCHSNSEDLCESFFNLNRLKGSLYDGNTRLFTLHEGSPISMYSLGGLAEYYVTPLTAVYPIPPPSVVSYENCSIIGCSVFTAFGAIKHAAQLQHGQSIAVIGAGGVGQSCIMIAKAFGASEIVAVDINDDKLLQMREFGATNTINAKKENVVERLREFNGGRGVDVCIEAIGLPQTFVTAFQGVRDGGRAVMVGIAPQSATANVEITRLVRRKIQIVGSFGAKARQDMPTIMKMITNGHIKLDKAVTRKYSLEDAGKAYKDLLEGKIIGRAIVQID